MKKLIVILLIVCLLMVFVACGKTPSNIQQNAEDGQTEPAPTKPTKYSAKNSDIVALGNALDSIKSLQELAGLDIDNVSATTSAEDDDAEQNDSNGEGDDYLDFTIPDESYYSQYFDERKEEPVGMFYSWCVRNNDFYTDAKKKKNQILKSKNLLYLNVWYKDGKYLNRVTYDETINDLICESFEDNNTYVKLNIGRNAEGKLYYSYYKLQYDDIPLYGGLKYQASVEYLEDSYYNDYLFMRGESGYGDEQTWTNLYSYTPQFQIVDFSGENVLFYQYFDQFLYERESLKRFVQGVGVLDDDTDADAPEYSTLVCYELFQNGNSLEYHIANNGRYIEFRNATDVEVFRFNEHDGYYSGSFNLYEMSGVKAIKGTREDFSEYLYGRLQKWTEYDTAYFEFENGQVLNDKNFYNTPYIYDENLGRDGKYIYVPFFAFAHVSSADELYEIMDQYGIEFKDCDLEHYINRLKNTDFKLGEYTLNYDEFGDVRQYFLSKVYIADFEEVKKDYENVELIEVPYKIDCTMQIDGKARVTTEYIDMSELSVTIGIQDEFVKKFIREFDIYYNDILIWDFDYDDFGNGVFTFEVNKILFEEIEERSQNKISSESESIINGFNWGETDKLFVAVPKYDIVIEIPIIINATT